MLSWQASDEPHMDEHAGWRRMAIRLVLVCLAGVILVAMVRPASAAYILKYFTATTVNNQLLLEWETIEEYNISGFEIFCKGEFEPDEQYHPIGTRPAVGSPESGVAYNFLVEDGLEPDVTYCFRLREITTDGTPPQYNDICGYGINIDPDMAISAIITPTLGAGLIAGTPTVVQVLLPTPIAGEGTPITIDSLDVNLDAGPISISGPSPLTTPTPAPPVVVPQSENPSPPGEPDSPLPTPTTPVILPQSESTSQPESPLQSGGQESPLPTPGATDDEATGGLTDEVAAANDANNRAEGSQRSDRDANQQADSPLDTSQAQNGDAATSPISSPTPIPTFTPTLIATPTWTPTWTPTPISGVTATPLAATEQSVALADGERPANEQAVNAQGLNAPAQSTPSYIVVTATATPLATFTAYPTALPVTQEGLFALASPTVENLILLTLCFIFLGAGGIGMLGLTATMLYIRSRREPQSPYQIDQFDIDGYDINPRIDRQFDQIDRIGQDDDWLR